MTLTAMRRTATEVVRAAVVHREAPKEVSLTDPQATWIARPGISFFAYDANYLIDNKVGIIIDAEGTRANRVVEISVARTMIERVARRLGLQPRRLAGDTVYGAVTLPLCPSGQSIVRSHRCGTSRRASMAPSVAPILSSTKSVMSMSAQVAQQQKPEALQMDQVRRPDFGFRQTLLPQGPADFMWRTLDSRD
jgi:hypothetical protein